MLFDKNIMQHCLFFG